MYFDGMAISLPLLTTSASGLIDAPPTAVEASLRDAAHLGDWNPAIRVVGIRKAGEYDIKAHGLSGSLRYLTCRSNASIAMEISVPGLAETSEWQWQESLFGTQVTHRITWRGPLAHLIGPAQLERIGPLRIGRLREWTLAHAGITLDS